MGRPPSLDLRWEPCLGLLRIIGPRDPAGPRGLKASLAGAVSVWTDGGGVPPGGGTVSTVVASLTLVVRRFAGCAAPAVAHLTAVSACGAQGSGAQGVALQNRTHGHYHPTGTMMSSMLSSLPSGPAETIALLPSTVAKR